MDGAARVKTLTDESDPRHHIASRAVAASGERPLNRGFCRRLRAGCRIGGRSRRPLTTAEPRGYTPVHTWGAAMANAFQGDAGGYLSGVRVVELADEQGEYAGKLLAGLGAWNGSGSWSRPRWGPGR